MIFLPKGPVLSASGGAPPPPGGPGAPPPPPPPAVVPPSDAAAPDPEADKKSALLADLSKGAAVTKGESQCFHGYNLAH